MLMGIANHGIDVFIKKRLAPVKQVDAYEITMHFVDDILECLQGHIPLFSSWHINPCWTERAPQITDICDVYEQMGRISDDMIPF